MRPAPSLPFLALAKKRETPARLLVARLPSARHPGSKINTARLIPCIVLWRKGVVVHSEMLIRQNSLDAGVGHPGQLFPRRGRSRIRTAHGGEVLLSNRLAGGLRALRRSRLDRSSAGTEASHEEVHSRPYPSSSRCSKPLLIVGDRGERQFRKGSVERNSR